ncbi:hypothetical protein BN134_1489 [Cronobacter dublinensis 1210]|uniref:Uncharacterized protein n=1 Tax=Cronobacter dublinensis 1210 TaxID=1208656 RepID=A0ABM9Q5R4_9ENTR|nr:hypothetical protein BN134_1489 [Cronobacter dublinensis 1210]CCJ85076.1 hypothetical protein BN133_1453 [Cronobacter dublinensis 582]
MKTGYQADHTRATMPCGCVLSIAFFILRHPTGRLVTETDFKAESYPDSLKTKIIL